MTKRTRLQDVIDGIKNLLPWATIIENWRNFGRLMIGKSKLFGVKVLRDHRAKNYPLINASKIGDVGYDLYSVEQVIIKGASEIQRKAYDELLLNASIIEEHNPAGAETLRMRAMARLPKAVIPTGIRLEMSPNVWCSIEARSSSASKFLLTPDAIIDSGYRGELFAVVFNFGHHDYVVKPGERIVQAIFHERIEMKIGEVDQIRDSERGESGFGSTG